MALRGEMKIARQRARNMQRSLPHAVKAYYDFRTARVVVELSSKLFVSFSPKDAEGFERAKPSQLEQIEITPSGFGLHFPDLDADLYLPSLLEGILGSKQWMAARLGAIGGRSTSVAKRAASRANGKLGGRPKKQAG